MITRNLLLRPTAVALFAISASVATFLVQAEEKKPNIVIIWGDDIGQSNVSAYSKGMMGYKTPNIDRVANEGVFLQITTPSRAVLRVVLLLLQDRAYIVQGLAKWDYLVPMSDCKKVM